MFLTVDQLVGTLIAFALIGPDTGYARVCTQAESVCQNCVLGRCVYIAAAPFFGWEFGHVGN